MIESEYAKPCDADSIHMDAENHKKLAEAVKDKVVEMLELHWQILRKQMNVKTIIYRFVVGSSIKFLYLEKYDVVALGELLVDFTMNGNSEQAIHSLRLIPRGNM